MTAENYWEGCLIDEEFMAGILKSEDPSAQFEIYVVRHITGECVVTESFESPEKAIAALYALRKGWVFERFGACGSCETGKCKGESCKKFMKPSQAECVH